MQVNIFEDNRWENFLPLTYTRAVFDLRCGILKLRQKIGYYYPDDKCHLIVRKDLEQLYRNRFPQKEINKVTAGPNLFINASVLMNDEIANLLNSLPENTGLFFNQICLGFRKNIVHNAKIYAEEIPKLIKELFHRKVETKPINYIWELVEINSAEIVSDFRKITQDRQNYLSAAENFHAINRKEIFIGSGVSVEPNVVLDASKGPIFLDDNCTIMANAVIKGPAYIGKNSLVKVSAKIYSGTSIGKVCKVGGEIEETIFQGYSNKQHDGFLGHSYIGEWVNLGADTNNSDLKNNYKTVKAYFYPKKSFVDSGLQFLGMIVGDHSKTGINTMFNTGCVIGVGCNLYSANLFKGFIPSFSWGTAEDLYEYRFPKMLETARIVKRRRNVGLEQAEIDVLQKCFSNSTNLRKVYQSKKDG